MDVPNHTGILFHAGNWQDDSNGCVLLGKTCTTSARGTMITDSQMTFHLFMTDLDGIDAFPLLVEDGVAA